MGQLVDRGAVEALRARIAAGLPTMAICVGLQLLCKSSDETSEVKGLGVIDAHVERFEGDIRIPQMGWNKVETSGEGRFLRDGYGYFANSYRLKDIPEGWIGAISSHGGRFVAAIEKGSLLACQFHPELSGEWGLELMTRWLKQGD